MYSDAVLGLTALLSVAIVALLGLVLWKGKGSSDESEQPERRRAPRVLPQANDGEAVGRRVGNRRVAARRNVRAQEEVDDEDDYDPLADEIALPEGKIGVKKRAKLEAKAEKRNARERELEEREERKQRQEQLEETRKKEEEKQKEEEAQRLEEEKRLKEEKEKKELDEYLQMKAAFTVEEEGHDEEEDDPQNQNKLQQFIEYIQKEKVVQLEDLAGHFQMKTQDVIDRVQSLLEQEVLVGVIDDRGKFICITKEELQSVAKFIRQRGRVAISDLVESSNQLINLQPVA